MGNRGKEMAPQGVVNTYHLDQRNGAANLILDRQNLPKGARLSYGGGNGAFLDAVRSEAVVTKTITRRLRESAAAAQRLLPDRTLTFRNPPDVLNTLPVWRWKNMEDAGLQFAVFPNFPTDKLEVQGVLKGTITNSKIEDAYPTEYLEGVSNGRIKTPKLTGSCVLIGNINLEALGLGDPKDISVQAAETAIAEKGTQFVTDLKLNAKKIKLRLLRAEEVPFYNAVMGTNELIATSTRTNVEGECIAINKDGLKVISSEDTGVPPKFVLELI